MNAIVEEAQKNVTAFAQAASIKINPTEAGNEEESVEKLRSVGKERPGQMKEDRRRKAD